MADPITATGAARNPTRFGALTMGARQFTGLWTQRSPYRDADTAYLVAKFYAGSRFDSILDGLNREIDQTLSDARSPGSIVYNSNVFPPIASFFSWSYVQNRAQTVRVLADSILVDGTLEITSSQVVSVKKRVGLEVIFLLTATIGFMGGNIIPPGTIMTVAGLTAAAVFDGVQEVFSSGSGFVVFQMSSTTSVEIAFGPDTGTITGAVLPSDIFDATAGQQSILFSKSAGSGPSQFLAVNTQLYIGDGIDQKKLIEGSQTWFPSTATLPGTLINVGAAPGILFLALGGITLSVVGTESTGSTIFIYTDQENVPLQFTNLVNTVITFSGLTFASYLNGTTQTVTGVVSTTLGVLTITVAHAAYPLTADAGSATTGNGTTGTTMPGFFPTQFGVIPDAGQQWKGYGTALQNWGAVAPTTAPTLTPMNGTRFWQPTTVLTANYAILDTNGNIEVILGPTSGATALKTGRAYPTWQTAIATSGAFVTIDGTIQWANLGQISSWQPATMFVPFLTGANLNASVILDSNQNLQQALDSANSGATEPTWATAIGTTTADGSQNWVCLGPGVLIASQGVQYAYSYHAVDGSVSTSSPPAFIEGGILGPVQVEDVGLGEYLDVSGAYVTDTQFDQVWIWRTPIGEDTLILEDQIPADGLGATFLYKEFGIPDTSNAGQGALNALIAAPVDEANDPPPAGFIPLCFAFQRIWGAVGNTIFTSGGPDTIVGNGNTAFAPLDNIPLVGIPYAIVPVTVQLGGLLVFTTAGIQIILGTGTPTNPFYATTYYGLVNVSGYNAVSQLVGTTIFVLESNLKVSAIQVQYPFNPATGYTEVGFPIGDQLIEVTTGGINESLYNSATAFVSWNNQNTRENALYVADGATGWFRMSAVSPPESGYMWSPRRAIVGGTSAVQSVLTAPQTTQLLIGPPLGTTGPILARDGTASVFTDNGTPYPSFDDKGVTLMCSTGQWAEVAHISAKSKAVGGRPTVSVLLNEVAPSAERPFTVLKLDDKSNDPARNRKSRSAYSDRYVLAQNGAETTGDCILVRFDYGTQDAGDVLWDWGIFAAIHDEREEAAQKG
jgi:hypothetical protein